jgi:hypothetical protein
MRNAPVIVIRIGRGAAVSADGRYVYIVGPEGVMVSDDFGKTGTWVQTARLK